MTGPTRPNPPWEPWFSEAACKGQTKLFFGPHNERPDRRYKRELDAKRICANCPVRAECLTYVTRHKLEGVWGCTTERDRRRAYWAERKRQLRREAI